MVSFTFVNRYMHNFYQEQLKTRRKLLKRMIMIDIEKLDVKFFCEY